MGERTDYAAMTALIPIAVDRAVEVWRTGQHAVAEGSVAQCAARSVERRAWQAAATPTEAVELLAAEQELVNVKLNTVAARRANERIVKLRAMRAASAGEAL